MVVRSCVVQALRVPCVPRSYARTTEPEKSFALRLCVEKNELKEISSNIHLTETCQARADGLDGGEAF